RSEPIVDGERPKLYTWQVRLFKRDSVTFTGLVHEQAMVKGRLGRLDGDQYTLQHIGELTGNSAAEYSKMAMFERLSYSAYNEKIADYAFKLSIGTRGDDRSGPSNVARSAMLLYERLLSRDMDSEISDLDYFCYFWTRNIFYSLMRREYLGVLYAAANAHMELEAVREFRRADRGGEQFAISRIINKIGIIRFLGLDKDRNVEALNRRYRGSRQGIGLLQRLLLEQYGKVSRSSK
ncbi:MAG: hypothetical protein KGH58_04130, partial [Candidatus Micrarchaeota archaeon]|nr:hypothetical protein [Candidatus Micrarchaeota archaeon]